MLPTTATVLLPLLMITIGEAIVFRDSAFERSMSFENAVQLPTDLETLPDWDQAQFERLNPEFVRRSARMHVVNREAPRIYEHIYKRMIIPWGVPKGSLHLQQQPRPIAVQTQPRPQAYSYYGQARPADDPQTSPTHKPLQFWSIFG